jgi:hypothetical protein
MTMLTPQFGEHCSTTIVSDSITELLRQHAKRLIAEALEAEVNSVIAELKSGYSRPSGECCN